MLSIFGEREQPNYKYQVYRLLKFLFYWRVAGSSLSYVHTTYPDLLIFSMHENNRTESIITERGKYKHCICMYVRFMDTLVQCWDRRLGMSLSLQGCL